jgi:hypothetical protein
MRFLLALVLFAVALFCVFGFLATFEPGVGAALALRFIYGGGCAACLYGCIQAVRSGDES